MSYCLPQWMILGDVQFLDFLQGHQRYWFDAGRLIGLSPNPFQHRIVEYDELTAFAYLHIQQNTMAFLGNTLQIHRTTFTLLHNTKLSKT